MLVGFDFLSGDIYPVGKLIGIVVGHLYYYLTVLYPLANGGKEVMRTPAFVRSMLTDEGSNIQSSRGSGSQGTRTAWGKGSKLGAK